MEGIQGLRRQAVIAPPAARSNPTGIGKSTAPAVDTFTPSQKESAPAGTTKPLTAEQMRSLCNQYDVTNMTRDQFGSLLKSLRDLGAITQKVFSDGYSGAVPCENGVETLPYGQVQADFVALLSGLADRCATYSETAQGLEKAAGQSLAESYGCLHDIFAKLGSLSENNEEMREDMLNGVNSTSIPAAQTMRQTKTSATGNFQAALAKTAKAEQTELPDFSKMSDRQKLAALAKLHDSTDYSGMTDVEKYKLMNDRFEAAFPHVNSYMGGLFGPSLVYFHDDPIAEENHVKALPELIGDELHRQYSTTGLTKVDKLHREAYYSGMSNEEVLAAISKRHSGGTMADRYDTLHEMLWMGVGDARAIGNSMFAMRRNMCKIATGSYYDPPAGFSDGQIRAAYGYASGTKISWAEVKKMAQACAAEFGDRVSAGYEKTVQETIDELFDKLMNTETTKIW